MKKMKELQDEQEKLIEELERMKIQVQKKTQEVDIVSERIIELKEHLDYGSFKFVHANIQTIIQKIAPKHKLPEARDIHLSAGDDNTSLIASVPWSNDECSDENPCNANVCNRCTLQHFKRLLDSLLAGYYAK